MKQMTLIEMDGFLKGKCIPRDLKVNETNAEYLVRKFGELESKIALLEVQLKLSEAAERAWESSMMQACGEDGPKSVADKFAELEAKCAALATDNEKAMEAMRQADAAVKLAHEKFSALAAKINVINELMKVAEQVNKLAQEETEKLAHERNTLAAENAGLKAVCEDRRTFIMNGVQLGYIQVPTVETDPALETIRVAVSPQEPTPATDAFLAEVRASAIPDEATERDLFEEWVMEKIFISKTTLEGLRTDDGYRNSTLSGTDYNGMWSQWKAIRAAQLRQEAVQ
ncbi:hypothetical protein P2N20_09850 [Escherichia coli]